jgi:hypothetical protein
MAKTDSALTDRRGSLWHRWDLHFHTPASFNYEDGSVTNEEIVDRLVSEGVRVVAVTDHHAIDIARIRQLRRGSGCRSVKKRLLLAMRDVIPKTVSTLEIDQF